MATDGRAALALAAARPTPAPMSKRRVMRQMCHPKALSGKHIRRSQNRKTKHLVAPVVCTCIFAGCVKNQNTTPSPSVGRLSEPTNRIQLITLQYRISMDAVAPSQFVAVYPDGMTLGLKVHWKIGEQKKDELDALLATLEKAGVNGSEFTATARWIHEGAELEVYQIEKKF